MNKGYYKYFLVILRRGKEENIHNNFSLSSRNKAIAHAREFCDIVLPKTARMVLMHYDENDYNDKNETIQL